MQEKIKLTKWEKEPTISDLRQNLDDAEIDHQRHMQNVGEWLEYRNIEGAAQPKQRKGRSSIQPKLIRKQNEWRYASLSGPFLSTPDIFNVNPKTAGDRKRAQQNALVLNYQFNNKINKVDFIDTYVREAVDVGTTIAKVSWYSREEEVTETIPTYKYMPSSDPQRAETYMMLAQQKETNRDAYEDNMNPGLDRAITVFTQTGQVLEPIMDGYKTETKMVEVENHPTVEVCELNNIVIDPSCNGDLNKARFVIEKSKSSLDELRKDGRYKNLKYIMLESLDPQSDPDYTDSKDIESFSFKDEPRKQFVVYTYWGEWDVHGTGTVTPIVASWVGNVLIRMEENPYPFKRPPFVKAVYMPIRRSLYGEPDAALLEENQAIIGATTRGLIDIMGRSANGQVGTAKGFLDAVNKRKFARGDDYEFNGLSGQDPANSVYMHKFPELPRSGFDMLQLQNAEAESLTGVKAFSSGINSQALGQSVGGGRDAMDAASKREAGILLRLAEAIKEIGHMFISMNAEWLKEEEVIRITNEEFITVRRDDLAGRFDLELSISTAEEDNRKAEELAFMLQTTGNNMDWGLRNMILSDIARLRKMPGMAKRIEEYEPQPDPIEVKKAEMEIVLLEAQIAKEQALAAKHTTEAQANQWRGDKDHSQARLNDAKAVTEGAKSREIHSTADKKDQDYLNEHFGVDHERQKELKFIDAQNKQQELAAKPTSNA